MHLLKPFITLAMIASFTLGSAPAFAAGGKKKAAGPQTLRGTVVKVEKDKAGTGSITLKIAAAVKGKGKGKAKGAAAAGTEKLITITKDTKFTLHAKKSDTPGSFAAVSVGSHVTVTVEKDEAKSVQMAAKAKKAKKAKK